MEFNLKINLDNSAYEDENQPFELAENLDFIIGSILGGVKSGIVHDSNGNKTGNFEIIGD
jgi:hypothetical protein